MKVKPMLFSTAMVQAILAGRKTQTRRVLKHDGEDAMYNEYTKATVTSDGIAHFKVEDGQPREAFAGYKCPYGQRGDVLYVRETWYKGYQLDENDKIPDNAEKQYWVKADTNDARPADMSDSYCYHLFGGDKSTWPTWRPSIHMPKAAARIWLEVVDVRIQRLNDISETDAIAEGIEPQNDGLYWDYLHITQFKYSLHTAVQSFKTLYQKLTINKMVPQWRDNPWVWVVEFKVLSTNGKPDNIG